MKLCGKCGPGGDGRAHATGHCLGLVPLGGENDEIAVGANQDPDCLTIYGSRQDEMIHICDWPAMKATIDAFQQTRGGRT